VKVSDRPAQGYAGTLALAPTESRAKLGTASILFET
jgi:hypothetical protein